MALSPEDLVAVANGLGLDATKYESVGDVVFAILDEQADQEGERNPLDPQKRKRGRPKKAEMTPEEELARIPKHRGRKTKRELELIAIIEERNQAMARALAGDVLPEGNGDVSLRDEEVVGNGEVTEAEDVAEAEEAEVEAGSEDEVWAGDPGDGTDFIVVKEVPVIIDEVDVFGDDDDDDDELESDDDSPLDTEQLPMGDDTLSMEDEPMPMDNDSDPMVITSRDQWRVESGSSEDLEMERAVDEQLVKYIGVLEVMPDHYGFLRSSDYNYLPSPDDVFVGTSLLKKYPLRSGDTVQALVRMPHANEPYHTAIDVLMINGCEPDEVRGRIAFEHLTPLFPDEKFQLNGGRYTNMSTRIVDLFSPIGKGQRALIVAQPKTGKTILMKDIANAIAENHPEAYLMMLLIDERPEEVTDMARTVNAEVIASTFDEPAEKHVKIAGIVLEKAKRLVECGHDVVIFLDSITRLARAYNTVAPASGKVLTGGVDANALQKPKRFFGAARNIEGGGSLTIIATALIDTGSKMDEVIFEEFKGTGNMELQLDRTLSNKRIYPAVNLMQSSTRRDDLLQDETTLNRMWIMRKYLSDMNSVEAMNTILDRMRGTRNNYEFLLSMNS